MSVKIESDNADIKDEKAKLRKQAYETVASLKNDSTLSTRIQKAITEIKALEDFQDAKTVMIYSAMDGELDLTELFHEFNANTGDEEPGVEIDDQSKWQDKKIFVMPRAIGDRRMLVFEVKDIDDLCKGRFKEMVPKGTSRFIPKQEIDLVIVPGMMFDKKNYRLGRGAGYYDKLLAEVQCPNVGLAFSEQICDELPVEEHDRHLEHIIVV